MISFQKKFIFIHLPKTGGNSIQSILLKYSEDEMVLWHPMQDGVERFDVMNSELNTTKHATLQEYQKALGLEFNTFYKFICVRNPWERLISNYFSPIFEKTELDRDEFAEMVQKPDAQLKHYMGLDNCSSKSQFGNVDYIMRFESLEEDFHRVCKEINVSPEKLPHRNKSTREHYRHYYDEELKELVYSTHKDEIEYFGYKF